MLPAVHAPVPHLLKLGEEGPRYEDERRVGGKYFHLTDGKIVGLRCTKLGAVGSQNLIENTTHKILPNKVQIRR
jgi:hypothetical protein